MDVREINVLVLAYLGDTIYEAFIREFLIKQNISNVNDLQKESIKYVSAKSQAEILNKLLDIAFFNDSELDVIRRARNYKNTRHPKNCDIITYKYATALEALIGYLHIIGNNKRIKELMESIVKL